MVEPLPNNFKRNARIVNILSIVIPFAVALLIGIRTKLNIGLWTKYLPHVIAVINSLTAISLLVGLYFIKSKRIFAHKKAMLFAFVLGSLFLIAYILYHISNPSTKYGGEAWLKYIYYFFLISHIVLSIVVVRLVLLSLHYALSNQIEKHKKIVKWSFPIWLYVSVSGVIVYFLISPYYK